MNKIIQLIIAISFAFITEPCLSQGNTAAVIAPAKIAAQSHGYMIANYTIKDQATFNKYMEAAGSLVPKYNGKVIIYNENSGVLEETPA